MTDFVAYSGISVCAGILFFVMIMVAIIVRKNKRKRNWALAFSLFCFGVGFWGLGNALVSLADGMDEFKDDVVQVYDHWLHAEQDQEQLDLNIRYELMHGETTNTTLAQLQNWSPKSTPDIHFVHFGNDEQSRIPLPHPYAIHVNRFSNIGWLTDNTPSVTAFQTLDSTMAIASVESLNFDRRFILIQERTTQGIDDPWILIDYRNKVFESYDTQTDLISRARELGFEGNYSLSTVQTYINQFIQN